MNERRKADRYPLGVRIEFQGGDGLTRDVSGLGVLFDTDVEFGIGDQLDFVIVIPDAVSVQCQGKVVRVERKDGKFSTACAISAYKVAEDQDVDPNAPAHLVLQELRRHNIVEVR